METVPRGTGRHDPERVGSRHEDRRGIPRSGDLHQNHPQLESQARRDGDLRYLQAQVPGQIRG